jgi:hypothetical protein
MALFGSSKETKPVHEAGAVVPLPGGLAELDRILRLEVAAREVLRAGEGHEGELAFQPQRMERSAQRRMQAPVAIDFQ